MPQRKRIHFEVSPSVARALDQAPPAEHRRIEKLVTLSLRARSDEAAFEQATGQLERTMDEIGQKVRERGLTDALLCDILREDLE